MLIPREQSLFEWNGNRMKKPVKVIKDFVRPLVDRAVSQQADRHVQTPLSEGTTSGETCHLTLLDHLVDTLDGEHLYGCDIASR